MNKGLDRTFLEYDLKLNEESQDVIFKYLTSMKQTYDKAKQGAEDQEHIRLHGDAGTGCCHLENTNSKRYPCICIL